jgi:transcriptional regulator with XRE-family HTH domain
MIQFWGTKMSLNKPVTVLAQDLGERLSRYRLSRNLRQQDIAKLSGISRGAITRIEAGQGGTIDSLLRIMTALDLEDRIKMLLPDAALSPLDSRRDNDLRQRARKDNTEKPADEPWSWDK